MLKHFILLLTTIYSSVAFSQSLPNLSKQQMYADFDTLIKVIAEVSPQAPVRKAVTGFDLPAALAQLRIEIAGINNTIDFAYLVRKAITFCQDGHSTLVWNGYFANEKEYQDEGISNEAGRLLPGYDSILRLAAFKPFNLRLKYLEGDYYSIGKFVYKGTVFPAGLKIIECNGLNIHDYVKGLLGDVTMMRWDFENKRFFAENFFSGYHLTKKDSLTLTFKDGNKRSLSSTFRLADTLSYEKDNYDLIRFANRADTFKTVTYFPKEEILYIRVPRMTLGYKDYYAAKIPEEGRKGPIKKVFVDIRNNPGGADNVWTTILKNIIAEPLSYQNILLCNNSQIIKAKLLKENKDRSPYPAPFLDYSNYIIYNQWENILQPDSNSIRFSGKIYVFQNENIYSSAGSFTAVAQLADNIVTVGTSTGKLLGRGINPLNFELPHSKILYRIEPVIDFLNVKTAADVFHDKVEFRRDLSVDEYIERLKAKEFLYSYEYLINKDPVFKKALKLQ